MKLENLKSAHPTLPNFFELWNVVWYGILFKNYMVTLYLHKTLFALVNCIKMIHNVWKWLKMSQHYIFCLILARKFKLIFVGLFSWFLNRNKVWIFAPKSVSDKCLHSQMSVFLRFSNIKNQKRLIIQSWKIFNFD